MDIAAVIRVIITNAKKRKGRLRGVLAEIYHRILLPLVPDFCYCIMPKVHCGRRPLPCLKKKLQAGKKNEKYRIRHKKLKTIREQQLDLLYLGHLSERIESWKALGDANGVTYAYPLLDKRIVEFALGLPSEMYYREDRNRFLFRTVLEGVLPDDVRWGNYKYEPRRVERLYSLYEDAINRWLNTKKNIPSEEEKFVSMKCVIEEIATLNCDEDNRSDSKKDKIDALYLLIMVHNLNNHCIIAKP